MVAPPRNPKYAPGSGTRPSLTASRRLGRLRKGLPAVRMTERAPVWVASDSTNQPVRNSASEARKTHGSTQT